MEAKIDMEMKSKKLEAEKAVGNLNSYFICTICMHVVEEPEECKECSQLCCAACITKWRETNSTCANCST